MSTEKTPDKMGEILFNPKKSCPSGKSNAFRKKINNPASIEKPKADAKKCA